MNRRELFAGVLLAPLIRGSKVLTVLDDGRIIEAVELPEEDNACIICSGSVINMNELRVRHNLPRLYGGDQ